MARTLAYRRPSSVFSAFQLVNSGEGEKFYKRIKYNVEKSSSGYKIIFNKEGRLCSIIIDPSCNRRLVYEEHFKDSPGRINKCTKILNQEKNLTAQNVTVDIYREIIDKDKIVLQNRTNYYQNPRSKTTLKRNEDLINRKGEKYYVYPNGCVDKHITRGTAVDVFHFYNKEFALRAEILKKMMKGNYADKDLNKILWGSSVYSVGFLNQLLQNDIKIKVFSEANLPERWRKNDKESGVYFPRLREINFRGERFAADTVVHEMAHAYDDIKLPGLGYIGDIDYSEKDPVLLNLYENYRQRAEALKNFPKARDAVVWEEGALQSVYEYFAYAVQYYTGDPNERKLLKQIDPKMYAYLKTLKIFKKGNLVEN